MGQGNNRQSKQRGSIPVTGFEQQGGFVNFVEGHGRCVCSDPPNREGKQPLTNGDSLETDDGLAEVVLIPGYYLRLAHHTNLRILDLARDNLKLELTTGSAIIEIPMDNSMPSPMELQEIKDRFFNMVTVITPSGEYAVFKAGGYRFDVTSSRESRVEVLKGAVAVGGHILRSGDAGSLVTGVLGVDSTGKEDEFDNWSRTRAAALVASNQALKHSDWYKQMMNGGYLSLETPEDPAASDKGLGHVISARNGVADFVEKGVAVKPQDGDWRDLKSGAELASGDRLRTAPHTRAEVLPYPDFDVYFNGDTEAIYRTDADGNVSIDVVHGSIALFVNEAKIKRTERNTLKLSANGAEYSVTSSGYYRMNVFSKDESEILVYWGTVVTAAGQFGGRKRIVTRGENRFASSLDKETVDSFDIWSDWRNARSRYAGARRRQWYAGLWFFNPATREFTFVPGERLCKSPYGGTYSTMYLLNRASGPVRPLQRAIP